MWFWRKRKDVAVDGKMTMSDKVAGQVAGWGIKMQLGFAETMNKAMAGVSTKRMKGLVICFCLVAGGLSLYILLEALVAPNRHPNSLKVEPVQMPKHFDKSGDDEMAGDARIDEETAERVRLFKQSMDSLRNVNPQRFDSILAARPFLFDSIRLFEQLYQQQLKK